MKVKSLLRYHNINEMYLANLGVVSDESGGYALALKHYQQELSILREIGEPSLISHILSELGDLDLAADFTNRFCA